MIKMSHSPAASHLHMTVNASLRLHLKAASWIQTSHIAGHQNEFSFGFKWSQKQYSHKNNYAPSSGSEPMA